MAEEEEEEPTPSPTIAAAPATFPPKADYGAWGRPSRQWVKWVTKMRSSHHSTWQSAGIHDAIMNSTYTLRRRDDLLSNLIDKWNPATNTFLFRWGEATVTLEDVTALGGFAAVGESVSDSPPAEAEKKLLELFEARLELNASKAKRACLGKWKLKYMGSGSGVEHEAFLAYWLSKFVFPLMSKVIGKEVIPIAVRLGMGARISLAQPFLASVYRAMTLLKNGTARPVKASLSLVQVWAWERFPALRPSPKLGATGPRMARWDGRVGGPCTSIDEVGEGFEWRPYVVEMDVESFGVCVRRGELVGLERGCVEQYLPHRVARQLGMDRDRDRGSHGDAVMDQVFPTGDEEEEDLPTGDAASGEEDKVEDEDKEEEDLPAGDQDLPVGDAASEDLPTGEEEEEEEEEELPAGDQELPVGDAASEEEEEEVSAFVFKRTKRSYLAQFRWQRNVKQCCCASNLSEAFGDEGGDNEGRCAPELREGFGIEEGDEKNDSSVKGSIEERVRNLEHLVRLLEEGKLVGSRLKAE